MSKRAVLPLGGRLATAARTCAVAFLSRKRPGGTLQPPANAIGGTTDIVYRVVSAPLLHFILLGGAIFVASQYFSDRARDTRITITQDQVGHLAESYRLQYGTAV